MILWLWSGYAVRMQNMTNKGPILHLQYSLYHILHGSIDACMSSFELQAIPILHSAHHQAELWRHDQYVSSRGRVSPQPRSHYLDTSIAQTVHCTADKVVNHEGRR